MYVCQKEELHMTKAEKVADVIVRQHFTNAMELMEYLDYYGKYVGLGHGKTDFLDTLSDENVKTFKTLFEMNYQKNAREEVKHE